MELDLCWLPPLTLPSFLCGFSADCCWLLPADADAVSRFCHTTVGRDERSDSGWAVLQQLERAADLLGPQPAAAGGREQPTSKERYADIRKAFNMFDTDGSGARRPRPRAENCAPALRAALRARHLRGRRPRRVGSLRGAPGRRGRRVCARARRLRAAARRGGLFTGPCQLTRPPRARRRH